MILEATVIFVWGLVMSLPLFGTLAAIRKLRSTPSTYEHKETA